MKHSFDPHYQEYIRLFNAQEYWKSHEVLEELWLSEKNSSDRTFYKGMIQLAAVLYHVDRENFRGAWSLFESGSGYISAYPPCHLGIDRDSLLPSIKCFISGREKEGLRFQGKRPIIIIK